NSKRTLRLLQESGPLLAWRQWRTAEQDEASLDGTSQVLSQREGNASQSSGQQIHSSLTTGQLWIFFFAQRNRLKGLYPASITPQCHNCIFCICYKFS